MLRTISLVASTLALVSQTESGFVKRNGQKFVVDGDNNYSFGGANNYYVPYAPRPQVDDLYNDAASMGVRVLRTWAFNVIGNPAGGSSKPPNVKPPTNVYFHYWDPKTNSPKFNEGSNGVEKLDYAVKKAKEKGIRLILVLTNNWSEYGGAEQMNLWYGLAHHDDFFTDARTKKAYKDWVNYLLHRKNKFTGIAYKDEPAIFAWELINEVRCKGCKDIETCKDCPSCKPMNPSCNSDKIKNWVKEMADYVKSIDKNHLVGVGDEGFLKGGNEWAYDGKDGDHEGLVALPNIDFATIHTYPKHWKKDFNWGDKWIQRHLDIAKKYNKPFIMEEFGDEDFSAKPARFTSNQDERNKIYDAWASKICKQGGNWMFWMISARKADNENDDINKKGLYDDYDNLTVYWKVNGKVTPSGQKMKDRIMKTQTRKC